MTPDPRVSLVILTCNRAAEFSRTLERSAALPERPPIVVVDNGTGDGPVAASRRHGVRYLRMACNVGAAARNAGLGHARTGYVAFSDDDTAWTPGSLSRAADLLDAYPRLAVVSASVLVGPGRDLDPACKRMAESPLPSSGLPGTAVLGFLAGACVFRRTAFIEAGGYERRLFIGGEEALLAVDLASRGWTMVYSPELTVLHWPSTRRDPRLRRRLLVRNALWTSWLRAPKRDCLRITGRLAGRAMRDSAAARGVVDAALGLGWALRLRRKVPPDVAAMMRLLEQP